MGISKNLEGQRFSRLIAIKLVGQNIRKNNLWECKCDCGNTVTILARSLLDGKTQSCGCLQKERVIESNIKIHTTHDKSKTNLYSKWAGMKRRCYNLNDKRYPDYGGRGITLCEEWKENFETFYNWAINNGYKKELTIDRIDTNGNYNPSNCKWSTMLEQSHNKRNNRNITYKEKTQTIAEWSRQLGLNTKSLYTRVERGLNINLDDEIFKKNKRQLKRVL